MSQLEEYNTSEYHRLNMQVCRVVGAKASIDQALERALSVKSTPKWMLRYLQSAAERLPGISADLAVARDNCVDAGRWKPRPASDEATAPTREEAALKVLQMAGAE